MITAIALSIALSTTAPAPVQVQVKSDTIPHSIQIKDVESNKFTKDTTSQITWSIFGLTGDSDAGCTAYVVAYDKKGRKVMDANVPIPPSILEQFGKYAKIIDEYIISLYKVQKKK
jgi:hypothetical protein